MRFLRTPSISSNWSAVESCTHSSTVNTRGPDGAINLIAMAKRPPLSSIAAYSLHGLPSTGLACHSPSLPRHHKPCLHNRTLLVAKEVRRYTAATDPPS